MPADGKPGRARLLRKMLDPSSPPAEAEQETAVAFEEAAIFFVIQTNGLLPGIGEILRRRLGAVDFFPEASWEGSEGQPPHMPPFYNQSPEMLSG